MELVLEPPAGKPPTLEKQVLGQLEARLVELARQPPRAVILSSASAKYFCVGADVNAVRDLHAGSIGAWVRRGHRVFNRLEDLPCPVLAVVSGYALGGGLELALAADFILATPDAVFGQTEAKLGLVPGWGGTWRLARRVGAARAKSLFFTGELVDAATAHKLGLVDFVGTAPELRAEAARLVSRLAENSAPALAAYKKILSELDRAARAQCAGAEAAASRDCLSSPDTRRRVDAFLNRPRPTR